MFLISATKASRQFILMSRSRELRPLPQYREQHVHSSYISIANFSCKVKAQNRVHKPPYEHIWYYVPLDSLSVALSLGTQTFLPSFQTGQYPRERQSILMILGSLILANLICHCNIASNIPHNKSWN